MGTYREKPVKIEAFRFGYDDMPFWFTELRGEMIFCRINSENKYIGCDIQTIVGRMKANIGDYIIKGVNGEIYPCKPDIFEKTYEKVKE